jgi:PAS domain S-box-containing protein
LKQQEQQLLEKEQAIQQSQQALRESEERYNTLRDIFDSVIIHQDNKIVYANPSAAQLFKAMDISQLIGKSIIDFVHPDYAGHIKNRLQMVEQGQKIPLTEQKGHSFGWLRNRRRIYQCSVHL